MTSTGEGVEQGNICSALWKSRQDAPESRLEPQHDQPSDPREKDIQPLKSQKQAKSFLMNKENHGACTQWDIIHLFIKMGEI